MHGSWFSSWCDLVITYLKHLLQAVCVSVYRTPPYQEPEILLYWCWDSTTSTESDRRSSSYASSSVGDIKGKDAAVLRAAGNLPSLSDPGCPKGLGKGHEPEGQPKGDRRGRGNKAPAEKPPKAPKAPKIKTPEQESRSVPCQHLFGVCSSISCAVSQMLHVWDTYQHLPYK